MTKDAEETSTTRVADPDDSPTPLVMDSEGSLFEGLDLPESGTTVPALRPNDGLPALDSDLTEDEKKEFVALLNKEMPLKERAHQLALLARMKGTKTAAVGLRAIQEINQLCGLRDDKTDQDQPLFVLPEDVKVAVLVQRAEK